jgi:ABC-2 type transport system ATP-binding protein
MSALLFQDVSKTYRKFGGSGVVALESVSLTVVPGQIYGLLGPNGAGKTTLIKCALDLARADEGSVSIHGRSSTSPSARQNVGYLPEDHRLPDHMTADQLMDFVGSLCEMPKEKRKARTDELLEIVGLTKRRVSKIRTFSKGMRQRLGVAQALIHEPNLLILDEPNEGLDPLGRADMKDLLIKLKEHGLTVFISSHILTEIERLCDRVAILHEGRLVHEASVEELTQGQNLEDRFVELIRGMTTAETETAS